MNGRELLLKALGNEPTPRSAWVPFVGVHGAKMLGLSAEQYLRSGGSIVAALLKAKDLYRPDGLPVVFDLQLEAEILGCQMHWGEETPPSVSSHPLNDRSVADLPSFDVSKGRFPVVLDALREAKRRIGGEVAIYGLITGPFTMALHLMGTNVFLQMFNSPEAVHEVLRFSMQVAKTSADAYIENGADVVAVVDPMTSQISPAHFREFVAAYANDIFDHIRSRGAFSSLFVCGNATRNLENMCQTRCDNVSVDENISLESLRDLAGKHNKSFGGNLKLTTVLLLGSEDDARRDALRCLDIGGTKGYVLAPGCDLPFATPEANLQAVASLVHDEYQREVARAKVKNMAEMTFEDVLLPNYGEEDKVFVDVVTLDSASCAPCQYMVDAVFKATRPMGDKVVIREHKITTRTGLGHMAKLGVGQIPTICIDGEVMFPSIIPDVKTLTEAIEERIKAKGKT
ncbi:MAG TPA: uroporphyrinogen decarboxylase family protein [Phycisphaerae bacterium]|nr:uroporphyrinogen decarboxylase family protein [Phycisphaerae bacterium]HRY69989.1 uroporphyrinogen decarboxylase family protein [Phycisphaerae bacterium]HSA27198.1 uroporphyrinogen decarboxylase family protein [Phycisphaerae bacterium]